MNLQGKSVKRLLKFKHILLKNEISGTHGFETFFGFAFFAKARVRVYRVSISKFGFSGTRPGTILDG